MKYRIKIETYKSGRQTFLAQKKGMFRWIGIGYDGDVSACYTSPCDTIGAAMNRIDKNYNGNDVVQTIEFEYINK